MATPLSVLTRNRDFRRLFFAQLVIFGGDWFVMVPLLALLTKLTGNGFLGGVALAADNGIQALLLPYAGVVADRRDRRRIMMVANGAAFVAVLLLLGVRSPGTAWLGPVAVGAVAVAKAFYAPAASAALPNLVSPADLSDANAVAGSAWGTMTVVGSSIGGLLSAAFSPYTCFLITAALLAVAAALALGVHRPMQAPRDATVALVPVGSAMREAARFIVHRPRVAALVTVKSAVGFGNGVLALFPVLAATVFVVGPTGTGLLFAARGAGALIGPLLLRKVLRHRSWLLPGLALSMSLYGVSYIGVSLARWFPLVLVLVVIAHIAGGGNWAMSSYALQLEVPDRMRARLLSFDMMIATLAVSLSLLTISVLEAHVSTRVLVAGCGAVTLVYAIGWRLVTLRLPAPPATPAPLAPSALVGTALEPDDLEAAGAGDPVPQALA